MKRVYCAEILTTIGSLPPELIKVILGFFVQDAASIWPSIPVGTNEWGALYKGPSVNQVNQVATRLFRVCRVSHQWNTMGREVIQEEYVRRQEAYMYQDLLFYGSGWIMRQVAPIITSFTYVKQIASEGFQCLTNLTCLRAVLNNTPNNSWSLLQHFSRLDRLRVHTYYNMPVLEIYPSMLPITRLILKPQLDCSLDITQISRLTNLTALKIGHGWQYGDDSLRVLTRLTSLEIIGERFPASETFAMVPQLRKLSAMDCHLRHDGLQHLTNLRILDIGRCFSEPGSLKCASSLTSLTCLTVDWIHSDSAIHELSHIASLTILDLTVCPSIRPEHLLPLTRLCYLNHDYCPGLRDYDFNLPRCDLKEMVRMLCV